MPFFKKKISESDLGELLAHENHAYLGDLSLGALAFVQSIDPSIEDNRKAQTAIELIGMMAIGQIVNSFLNLQPNSAFLNRYRAISEEKISNVCSSRGVNYSEIDNKQHEAKVEALVANNELLKRTGDVYSPNSRLHETVLGEVSNYIIEAVYPRVSFDTDLFDDSGEVLRMVYSLNTQLNFSRHLFKPFKLANH